MATAKKTALILGVANQRSIAWACVQSFLQRGDFQRVVFTYQNERFAKTANDLIEKATSSSSSSASSSSSLPTTLLALPCNVETELPSLFQERLPEILQKENDYNDDENDDIQIDAIVHSIAYAPDMKQAGGLLHTSREAFLQAHDVSAYSLLETTQLALPVLRKEGASITTLSYLGAVRAVPNYNVMGPAKASLEALVRGLSLEIGKENHRINAVSAGPLNTLAARGISGMTQIRQQYESHAPLRRNVTTEEVADTVRFVATEATGMTGQTIYVDGGYSSIVPVGEASNR